MSGWLRRWYGSGPGHLMALTLGAVVGLYAGVKLVEADPWAVVYWLVGAAVLHDLVLVPAYSAIDRAARAGIGEGERAAVPAWYDHVRVPVLLSGLLFLVFFPLILRFPPKFVEITDTPVDVYAGRYLAIVAGLFVISGLAWIVRVLIRRRRSPAAG